MMNDDAQSTIFRKESLERLSSPEQLDQLMQVVSLKSWLPLLSLGSLIALALLWSIVGRIPITATGKGILVHPSAASNQLISLSYFSPQEGQQIQPGMELIIVPDTEGGDRLSGIWGRVKSVSEPPITTLDAARQITKADTSSWTPGAIEVVAELEPDPANADRYRWSSRKAGTLKLDPGTMTTTRITLQEKAPIAFVFPFLEGSP